MPLEGSDGCGSEPTEWSDDAAIATDAVLPKGRDAPLDGTEGRRGSDHDARSADRRVHRRS